MVNAGWSHADLNAMSEAEFQYLVREQIAYNEAVNKAQQEAIEAAKDK